ncbi:hypothetical protein LTR94_031505, partial [Friedmanniomyces endolithicus]
RRPVHILPARGDVMAAANITASMGSGLPLRIVREWVKEGNGPALRFTLTNTSSQAVEIGALGMPMTFDNIITDRNLEQAHAQASFADPYIGRDAGYLQVTRLNGQGPALLVLPEKNTPLEAYRPVLEARAAPPHRAQRHGVRPDQGRCDRQSSDQARRCAQARRAPARRCHDGR